MNWGKWIVVSFILFAGFIATLATVCMRQDISLVSKEYYKEELAYQDQIVRLKNTSLLIKKPLIKVLNSKSIQIDFDDFNKIEKGELKLFRPSDSGMDRTLKLKSAKGAVHILTTDELNKGMYRARMRWTMGGKEFFMEEVIFI